MATPPYLAAVEDLATLTGAPSNAPKLVLALKRASARFRGAVGHDVSRVTDDVELRSGDGSKGLLLSAAPVYGTPTVKVAGATVTDFEVGRRAGMLRRAPGWPDGLDNIEVTYSHGYLFENIPGDIEDAVLEQAELQYRILAGVQQATTGGKSMTFGAQATVGVTQKWADVVAKYRLGDGRA